MLVRPSVDPVNMLRLHPVPQVLEPTHVCCGLIAWVRRKEVLLGLIVFMLCRFSVVLFCVFFLISKTGILSFYLKINGFVKHGYVINLTGFVVISGTNTP